MYHLTVLPCRGVATSKFGGQINATLLARRGLATFTGTHHGPSSGLLLRRSRGVALTSPDDRCTLHTPQCTFIANLLRRSSPKVKVDDLVYDTETLRYRGTIFGLPADTVVFYFKIFACVALTLSVMYIFFKGIFFITQFSPQMVARMGFVSGFLCCMVVYTTALQVIRRAQINSNAVYNHSIALVMRNTKVREFLGEYPRTGIFKAYAATGGFKLPLLRRIRSGSYEISDLLGLKPRRLQMVFVLKAPSGGREGVVYCDVCKESTGLMTSEKVYKSLVVTLIEASKKERERVILIGRPEDIVDVSLLF